jgi:hypothetical protein
VAVRRPRLGYICRIREFAPEPALELCVVGDVGADVTGRCGSSVAAP